MHNKKYIWLHMLMDLSLTFFVHCLGELSVHTFEILGERLNTITGSETSLFHFPMTRSVSQSVGGSVRSFPSMLLSVLLFILIPILKFFFHICTCSF